MTTTYTNFGGMVVKENRGGTKRGYVPDPQGNTVALVDSSGAITDTWKYRPYGEVESHTGSSTTPFTFIGVLGYYKDTGVLTYVRARYYNAPNGQWQTMDPIWPEEAAYSYVGGNPINLVDFWGNQGSSGRPRPSGGKICSVYICDVNPGKYGGKPGHRFTCVAISRPDGSKRYCSGGYYPPSVVGAIIGRGQVGDGGYQCPIKDDPSVKCSEVVFGDNNHDVCRFADHICRCIDKAIANPGLYSVGFNNCLDFSQWVLECACVEGGPYPGLLGNLCSNWIQTGYYKRKV